MNKRVVGKQYEDMAVSYLSENAYIIIDRISISFISVIFRFK